MTSVDNSDFELWAAVRLDKPGAFTMLYNRYWIRLYKAAKSLLNDDAVCEEVVHDVFLNIWSRRKELEIDSACNFLLAAVRYQIYNRMRAAKLNLVYVGEYEKIDYAIILNTGNQKIDYYEIQEEVLKYLDELPKRCHEIFAMSRTEQLSNQEIAERLGISKRSVENQIALALKHLKKSFR